MNLQTILWPPVAAVNCFKVIQCVAKCIFDKEIAQLVHFSYLFQRKTPKKIEVCFFDGKKIGELTWVVNVKDLVEYKDLKPPKNKKKEWFQRSLQAAKAASAPCNRERWTVGNCCQTVSREVFCIEGCSWKESWQFKNGNFESMGRHEKEAWKSLTYCWAHYSPSQFW